MTLEDFEDALDRHGGDLARWPAEERQAAEALLARDPAAQPLLREAQELDTALGPGALPAPAEADLTDRIMRRVAQHEVAEQNRKAEVSARKVGLRWLRELFRPASWQLPRELVAVGCGTAVGLLVGMGLTSYWPSYNPQTELFSLFIRSYF